MDKEHKVFWIINRIARMSTRALINIPIVIALIFLLAFIFVPTSTPPPIQGTLLALSTFFWGLAGVPMIVRKEADFTIFRFDGVPALILGIIVILSCSFGSVLFIMGIIKSLSR